MTKVEFAKHAYGLVEKAMELRQVAWNNGDMKNIVTGKQIGRAHV